MNQTPILPRITEFLTHHGVAYRHVKHAPTRTSAEAAAARDESIRIGGKALVFKANDGFHLIVVSAALKLNNTAVKELLGSRKPRFATPEELLALTGLVPGSVPPFGVPILPLPLFVDESVLENERIAFNAGSLTDSIILSIADYRRIATIARVVRVADRSATE